MAKPTTIGTNRWAKGRKIPGSGRVKGTPNKAVSKRRYEPDGKEEPLAFLLRVMRNRRQPLSVRINAAAKAAPYCHPALKSVEFRGHMLHGVSGALLEFIKGNATASRSFLGFDREDQHAQEAPHNGSVPHS